MVPDDMCQVQRLAEGGLRGELSDAYDADEQDLVGEVAEEGILLG